MDLTEADVVKRVLAEQHLTPERALVGLLQTLSSLHLTCKLRPEQSPPPRGLRASILEELGYLTARQRDANAKAAEEQARDDEPDNEVFVDGLVRGDLARVQSALAEILITCQLVAERGTGLDRDDDEDDRPRMRLVRD